MTNLTPNQRTFLALPLNECLSRLKNLQKSGTLGQNEFLELIRFRGLYDFEFFVRYFFPHFCRLPFSRMHYDFFVAEREPFRRGRYEVIAAPRNHAKTTFKTFFKVLHAIVYKYESFILILSHSAPEAELKVNDILQELCNNELIKQVYGSLAPVTGRGKKRFITQNGIMVMGKSKGAQVRGLKYGPNRPSLILCDDIEALESMYNPEQRQKTRDWFRKDILKLGQADGSTNITVVGTCLHPESLLMTLLETPGWDSHFYQAMNHESAHPELWNQYREIYINLSNPQRVHEAHEFYLANQDTMLSGTEVLWPEGDSYERLIKMQIDEGLASFFSEKQNQPFDPENQIFVMDKAKRFKLVYEGHEWIAIQWLDGSDKRIPVSDIQRMVAFHDPALADSKKSDYAAIVVVAEDKDGYLYCLDAYIEKVVPSRQIEQAIQMHQKWGFPRLYLETNNFQGILRPDYLDELGKYPKAKLQVIGVNQHHNKQNRISSLEPPITNGYLLFADTLPEQLISQLRLFPTGYDDGPDALQGAVAQLQKRVDNGSVPPPTTTGNAPPAKETYTLPYQPESLPLPLQKPYKAYDAGTMGAPSYTGGSFDT